MREVENNTFILDSYFTLVTFIWLRPNMSRLVMVTEQSQNNHTTLERKIIMFHFRIHFNNRWLYVSD